MTTRRNFLRSATVAATVSTLSAQRAFAGNWSFLHSAIDPGSGPDDPKLRELAMRALNAATARGATYVDVRFTADRTQQVSASERDRGGQAKEQGSVFVGVRALVDGYWGFAAGCSAEGDTIERLAHEAADQAKVNNWGAGPSVVLDGQALPTTGSWTTPMERDPFTVSVEEKADFLSGIIGTPELLGLTNIAVQCDLSFRRQQKVFASSAGAYLTQTLIWTGPSSISVSQSDRSAWSRKRVTVPLVPLQSSGYEATAALRVRDQLPQYVETLLRQDETVQLPVGRYQVVFDAQTVANLMMSTFGHAIEMDRIAGDEINSVGTSYLSPKLIGTPVFNPMISVSGTRTLAHGPSHVAWDDDGVAAQSFDVINKGVLTMLATGREHAGMAGGTGKSTGCSVADHAANLPLVRSPDLVLKPSEQNTTFDSLVRDVKSGVAVMYSGAGLDRSLATGQGSGTMFEIRDGQLGRCLDQSVAFRFRTTELWKNITAIGGASSAELHSTRSSKGEPTQQFAHGAVAVPMLAHDVTMFDPRTF